MLKRSEHIRTLTGNEFLRQKKIQVTPELLQQVARDAIDRDVAFAIRPAIEHFVNMYKRMNPNSGSEPSFVQTWNIQEEFVANGRTFLFALKIDMQNRTVFHMMGLLEAWLDGSIHFTGEYDSGDAALR